jgi:hypothetical protein
VREETGRTEEPPVGVSRATSTAVFVTQKLRHVTTFGNANMYPHPILTPLLNILDFALGAAYNRHS